MGLAGIDGGFGTDLNRLALVCSPRLDIAVKAVYLKGHSIFANSTTNDFAIIPERLTLDEVQSMFSVITNDPQRGILKEKMQRAITEISFESERGELAESLADEKSVVIKSGACVALIGQSRGSFFLWDEARQFRYLGRFKTINDR
jgi:hypothetical protein